jgi:transmembrane sensor
MEDKEIEGLLAKHLSGSLTDEERDLLDSWYWQYNEDSPVNITVDEIEAAHFRILQKLPKPAIVKKVYWKSIAAIAASILVILTIGFYFLNNEKSLAENFANNDIRPGGYKAILILANGVNVNLDEVKNGEITNDQGVRIVKLPDGQLQFKANDNLAPATPSLKTDSLPALVSAAKTIKDGGGLNVMLTPKGGQYHIALPDGTNVWINAGSTLRFPSSFKDMPERRVHLTGEAYFEVSQVKSVFGMQKRARKVPFIVQTDKQEITVLGTHFNVNSYADEANIKTTLLEGSVKVSSKMTTVVLKPGMQAVNDGEHLDTYQADVNMAVAWKNGEFSFRNETLENIMRQVGRWYNVTVVYENQQAKKTTLGGTISKFKNVSQVLKMLETTGEVKFKIEPGKITVRN